jgi:hypothetical protein
MKIILFSILFITSGFASSQDSLKLVYNVGLSGGLDIRGRQQILRFSNNLLYPLSWGLGLNPEVSFINSIGDDSVNPTSRSSRSGMFISLDIKKDFKIKESRFIGIKLGPSYEFGNITYLLETQTTFDGSGNFLYEVSEYYIQKTRRFGYNVCLDFTMVGSKNFRHSISLKTYNFFGFINYEYRMFPEFLEIGYEFGFLIK